MVIGHHILYGKTVELDQPFVAITKQNATDTFAAGQGSDLGTKKSLNIILFFLLICCSPSYIIVIYKMLKKLIYLGQKKLSI